MRSVVWKLQVGGSQADGGRPHQAISRCAATDCEKRSGPMAELDAQTKRRVMEMMRRLEALAGDAETIDDLSADDREEMLHLIRGVTAILEEHRP